ncbi:MAG: S41 family peptidase [Chitinophagaceae bacterium]|nr:S41 family peptidase [Chitinophagaceae bacterium]MCZ2395702.1 S41 family peptidase [Chitinophagales bacterium]
MASKKKLQVWLPLILSLCVVAGMFIGYRIRGNMPNNKSLFFIDSQKPVQEVIDLIQRKYVDTVNIDSLGNVAIENILEGLDPHSVYIPYERLQEINEDLEGVFFGIGIEFSIINDTTHTLRVIKGGPSDKAGLQTGDEFIKVGDSLVAGNHTTEATLKNLMRGKNGTKVTATILRDGQLLVKEITRGPVPIVSIDAAYMLNDTTAFIRISRFSERTYKEFMTAMDTLQRQGMKSLILDLRDNGGGILNEAIYIADEFLDGDKLITYTIGAHAGRKDYKSNKEGIFEKGKLVVLINEGTASASEVLAGALQDWGRAEIVGRRSFGKGLVQEQYELSDGSGLRLTVARYFTPVGRSIQRPYTEGTWAYYHDMITRFERGEMNSADSINHKGEPQFLSKTGKVLYGGGGITPDVFVGVDNKSFERPIMRARIDGKIDRFVYYNFLNYKNEFRKYNNAFQFEKEYSTSEPELHHFKQFLEKDSITLNLANTNQKIQAASQIKMLTARLIWGTQGYFEIKNYSDSTVLEALQVLKK